MSYETSWNQWRQDRLKAVVDPLGNLALIETRWFGQGESSTLEEATKGKPQTVLATELERKDFDGTVVAQGLRLWDSNSESIQAFQTIDTYPFDAAWVIEAIFTPHPEDRAVAFEYIRDNGGTRDLVVPGDISAKIDGVDYTLNAFDDDGVLLLVFGDKTNGSETYPAGRFLFVDKEEGSNKIILNFNQAFVPPCGFSIHYNCPMPPPQNRLHLPVRAGEKIPVFKDGYEVH
ncbi:unannotated protein [freshwater metagenome]|jgi:uncharacterized protein (DUF1684 family)|uniref:Unannotated protein n=1 Tax=freshwater metagenome TaxID=449393 RepID=A0A6J6MK22_9ZZZZ|nr:DUF1684 domain-containing protein [Actinomycetota bacterium]MTA67162.1 DUF1684 domain-containing protein [Actinomycetota bacterium]